MSSASGLSREHRIRARDRAVHAAWLAYNHRGSIYYTQGYRRWDGIRLHRNARIGQFPHYADCSSFITWCLWNGLYLGFQTRDVPNGLAWRGGFTGTLLRHGKRVRNRGSIQRGDYVIYGSGGNGKHTTIVVGRRNGVPMVMSMGSSAGPLSLPYN